MKGEINLARKITLTGMLSAIMILINFAGLGALQFIFARITILHIPVIIGSYIGGLYVGVPLGALFGLLSMYNTVSAPGVLSFCFLNPLVSIVPRILIAVSTCAVKRATQKLNTRLSITLSAAAGSATNTIFVLLALLAFYPDILASIAGNVPNALMVVIGSMFVAGGTGEAAVAVLLSNLILKSQVKTMHTKAD